MNETIYVICDSPAAFFNESGDIFVITRGDLGKVIEAPKWICGTIVFGYLMGAELIRIVDKPEEPKEEKPKKKPGKKK